MNDVFEQPKRKLQMLILRKGQCCLQFVVDVGISADVLQSLHRCVGAFVADRGTDFASGCSVQLTACADPLKVVLTVGFEFSHNGVDAGRMARARSDLLQVTFLPQLQIQGQ